MFMTSSRLFIACPHADGNTDSLDVQAFDEPHTALALEEINHEVADLYRRTVAGIVQGVSLLAFACGPAQLERAFLTEKD
jgi:hypothetical protein